MTLTEYIHAKRAAHTKRGVLVVPNATEIRKKWTQRVIPRSLHTQGAEGARQYLTDYGKGIAAPKCVALAICAEVEKAPDMALGFWRKAYELEEGHPPEDDGAATATPAPPSGDGGGPAPIAAAATPASSQSIPDSIFPVQLSPGRIVTMQPVDAPHAREWYVDNPLFWGQPKRDGQRLVIGVEHVAPWFQARSGNLQDPPSVAIIHALKKALKEFGPFILDGELFYLDAEGGEHRTSAQAASVNIALGKPQAPLIPRYGVFKALYAEGQDLRHQGEDARITAGEKIGGWIVSHGYSKSFELVPTARTRAEKTALCERQKAEGREGEIWILYDARYTPDKRGNETRFVRTKYTVQFPAIITNLTTTTADGRPFGAMEIGVMVNGEVQALGAVGTGFDHAEMATIAERHAASPGQVVVNITSQGFTEGGKVWHGRFAGFSNKASADCTDPRV